MTEEAKERYNEDLIHFEVIRSIVKEELKTAIEPINEKNKVMNGHINWFISVGGLVIAFMIGFLFAESKDVQGKVSKVDFDNVEKIYMKKFDYYQIEMDEHRVTKGILKDPVQADYLFDVINDNIAEKLGFKYTTRGETK